MSRTLTISAVITLLAACCAGQHEGPFGNQVRAQGSSPLATITVVPGGAAADSVARTDTAETDSERDERMNWWRDARFGMFVHWGLYSGLAGTWDGQPVGTSGGMEWIQQRVGAATESYAEHAIPLFKPKSGFATEWAQLAQQAGCRYVVFTTKHHDGFALHDSAVSDYDAGSVLDRDLVREIVDACRAAGLRVGFYHSVIDWHHDQYAYELSQQLPHPLKGKPYPNGSRDHSKYVEYLHAQVRELTSNYGPIDILWWDYSSVDFQGDEAWRATELMQAVRGRQPAVIMNNRLYRKPEAGFTGMGTDAIASRLDPQYGDFITPEQHIPATGMPGVDWETCMTMNTTWGYSEHDHAWKSSETLLRNLIDIASKGGNYLLNIGPMGDGSVPPQSVEAMRAIGTWMQVNGEAIYGTTASPCETPNWGRCTQKQLADGKRRLYLHVFDWPADGKLTLPLAVEGAVTAHMLDGGARREVVLEPKQVTVVVPQKMPDTMATVVVLDIDLKAKSSGKTTGQSTQAAAAPVQPTLANVAYGLHERQVLDFYRADTQQPAPLLFHIHGGGWVAGDKARVAQLQDYLNAGVSVVSINYRYSTQAQMAGVQPPVSWPLHDAARALQFVRSRAEEWNIDTTRIAATGGSAGACSSLWLAFHDDLADPASADPVARESTRLRCAAVIGAQTTLDPQQMKQWTPNSRYGGHAFGFMPDPKNNATRDTQFDRFLAAREQILPWIQEYSPYAHVSSDDPPIYMIYGAPPALGENQKDPTHTANFGVKLQERLREAGVACELVYPGAPDVQHSHPHHYLIEMLTGKSRQ